MSDEDDQDRIAERRAEKLSRALDAARARRGQGSNAATPERAKRKAALPPPPPIDADELRAMGLPIPESFQTRREPSSAPRDPLVLGTGETRALEREATAPPQAPRPLFPQRASPQSVAAAAPKTDRIPLLRVSGLHTDIARYKILRGVDLEVPEGGVTMLLGRNGVGKTTTLRSIMGLWRPRQGDIWMGGRNLARMAPAAIARCGVGYVPEDMGIFGDLTVEENMRLGALSGRMNRARVDWLLNVFPALKTFWGKPAATLSGGQKQMLSIARTMIEPRRLYLIDEPTKGLAPAIVSTLAAALRELKHEGATILMVEQNFAVARVLGDTCAVMDDGQVVWSGAMDVLAGDARLQSQLMGLHLETGQ